MRLIGLHGRYHSGKDEVFSILDKDSQERGELALRRAFADPLKISGMRALGLNMFVENDFDGRLVDLANQVKETGRVSVSWETPEGELVSFAITGRELWQLYGTEAHRATDLGHSFHPNFWVDNLLPLDGEPGKYDTADVKIPAFWKSFAESWAGFADYAVVTDVRFPNEAQRIRELGGEIWWINAEDRIGPNVDGHSSETKLDDSLIDKVIDNNHDLESLKTRVLDAIDDYPE